MAGASPTNSPVRSSMSFQIGPASFVLSSGGRVIRTPFVPNVGSRVPACGYAAVRKTNRAASMRNGLEEIAPRICFFKLLRVWGPRRKGEAPRYSSYRAQLRIDRSLILIDVGAGNLSPGFKD